MFSYICPCYNDKLHIAVSSVNKSHRLNKLRSHTDKINFKSPKIYGINF